MNGALSSKMALSLSEFLANPRKAIFGESGEQSQAKIAELETSLTSERAKVVQLTADVATSRQSIQTLTSNEEQLTTAKVALEKQVPEIRGKLEASEAKVIELQAIIDKPQGEIQRLASIKASELAAAQGIPPVTTQTTDNPASTKPSAGAGLKGLERAIALHRAELAQTR